MAKVVTSTIWFILSVSQIQTSCFTKRDPLNAELMIATWKPWRSAQLCVAHDKNVSVKCPSLSLDKIRLKEKRLRKNRSEECEAVPCRVPIPKATAEFLCRAVTAVVEAAAAAAGGGFSSTYSQKPADDLNIFRNRCYMVTSQNFKGPKNPNKKVGRLIN